jgi:hypothetical protein
MVCPMNADATDLMKQFIALPPSEQLQVRKGILEHDERVKAWEKQKAILREMQSRHKGQGGLKVLLETRKAERARG